MWVVKQRKRGTKRWTYVNADGARVGRVGQAHVFVRESSATAYAALRGDGNPGDEVCVEEVG